MANARQSKAGRFVQQRLFSGLSSFVELERRIADLPDEKSRGDAFEVFTEAYLATQRKHDAETVWPLPSVPTAILGSLQLAMQDYGVDGVLKTRLGKFSAYQVKFRTGRPALTWRELSTFMGLADSPNIHSRILLTNCDDLPSVLNDRQGFFCIRGSDLDRLEADDFKAIESWLANSAYQAPKKTPQPHQGEAFDKILPAFNEHDRVSAIMACGTGKTLVALWVAEKMQASRILVLVPSLALLRQILHEWLRETNLPALAYLCVCSDPTVKEGLDAIDTKQSDLDFQVSTDTASVREFLDASFGGVKIIFSTFQSAQVVGAALKPGEAFDLAVFDEAHKTAGREGRNYGFALEDANLPIRKRLFLTATPRHYNPHQHDREGEAKLLFSMDNPEVYGPQAYRLTFAEAARRGIICGYKVIISVITSEMVTNELLSRGEVVVNGDAVRARQVANQIALRDAIEKSGAGKVFTFHKTVESAASFVADGSEGVRTHLPEFGTFHVNGTMPTARREREMRDFRTAARAVMSNARCLTEGVDVPAVDMVAFLSPRRSRIDIVQAVGRAMRKPQHSPKTMGYVLVPLYVELAAGETIDAAVNRAEFAEVWDVLQSMQEQDDILAEAIRRLRQQKGRGLGFDDAGFRERIEVTGPQLTLDIIRATITATCIEQLGSPWEERFGELVAYKSRFGDCAVPTRWKENRRLATWVVGQRQARKLGELPKAKIERLELLGFNWNPNDRVWDENFGKLSAFAKKSGHCKVPQHWAEDRQLGVWVAVQRRRFHSKQLARDRVDKLTRIGFEWTSGAPTWDEMFAALQRYWKENGHFDPPSTSKESKKLSAWIRRQRHSRREGTLAKDRVDKLNGLGFPWTAKPDDWEAMFDQLAEFHVQHGHCRVSARGGTASLYRWIRSQRAAIAAGVLGRQQITRLKRLGFALRRETKSEWMARLSELQEYNARFGNCNVPKVWPENQQLADWVRDQQKEWRRGRLPSNRVALLADLGLHRK
ncbi:MAG: Helicase associated domain protein [Verrucomicrobia bacterium]|nr:Helicase associated domain protein [Verrucomicrobiota bacterium]